MNKVVILFILSILTMGGCATNPITGESEFMLIPESQEEQIGEKYAPVIKKELGGKIEDPEIQNYIQDVGEKVVSVSHTPGKSFEFAALDHESVNAMALPDGTIYITRGMLESMSSEAQLASVLAHEVAHVTARHVSSAMSKQIGIDLMLGVISTQTKIPRSAQTVANFGRQIISLKFSREDEREADIGGLRYMIDAGYDPQAFIEVMDILNEQSKGRNIEFLSSHPLPTSRREELRMRIQNKRLPADLKVGKSEYENKVLDKLK